MAARPEDLRAPVPRPATAGGPVVVTPMRRRHLRSVLRIEAQQPHPGWSVGLFLSEIGQRDARTYLVARQGSTVVGFIGVLYAGDDGHITTLAVDERCRRQAIASRLLLVATRRAVERGAANLTLEVRASNEPALALYRRFGFAPVGVRKGYYADGDEDAIVMWATGIDQLDHAGRLDAIEAALATPILIEELG